MMLTKLYVYIYLLIYFKGLLDYAIKIAATWVACKKLHARIARPFTLRIQHRAIFISVSVIVQILGNKVARNKNTCNKNPTSSGWNYCSCLQLSVQFVSRNKEIAYKIT